MAAFCKRVCSASQKIKPDQHPYKSLALVKKMLQMLYGVALVLRKPSRTTLQK